MATPTTTTDRGFVVLLVPFGARKSRRLIIPHEVAAWLRDELAAALLEIKPAAAPGRRQTRKGR